MSLAYALTSAIGIVVIPEITVPGFEGVIYGAVTTYTNQAMNVANAINNLLLAVWPSNTNNDELKALAPAGRHSLVMAITICAIALVAVVGIAVTSTIMNFVALLLFI